MEYATAGQDNTFLSKDEEDGEKKGEAPQRPLAGRMQGESFVKINS